MYQKVMGGLSFFFGSLLYIIISSTFPCLVDCIIVVISSEDLLSVFGDQPIVLATAWLVLGSLGTLLDK